MNSEQRVRLEFVEIADCPVDSDDVPTKRQLSDRQVAPDESVGARYYDSRQRWHPLSISTSCYQYAVAFGKWQQVIEPRQ